MTVRLMEGAMPLPSGAAPAPPVATRSSSIPTVIQTPAIALHRTPYKRSDLTPTTPGRTPFKAPGLALKATAEICAKVGELGAQLTPEQLRSPTYDVLHPVYQALVRVFREPAYAFCDDNEIHFIRDLREITTSSGYQTFSLVDLMEPDPKRTKRILSALLTYNDFRVARARSYEQALLTLVQHKDIKTANLTEVERLRQDIVDCERGVEANRPEVQRLEQDCAGLVHHLQRYKDERGRLEAQKQELQQRLNTAKDHNANLKYAVQKLSTELPQLSKGLVASPARVRQETAQAHTQLEHVKAALAALQSRLTFVQFLTDREGKAEAALDSLLDVLRATDAEKRGWKAGKAELQRLRAALSQGAAGHGIPEEIERLQRQRLELSSKWNQMQAPESLQLVDPPPVPREEQEITLQDLRQQISDRMLEIRTAEEEHWADVKRLMEHLSWMEQRVRDYAVTVHQQLREGCAA